MNDWKIYVPHRVDEILQVLFSPKFKKSFNAASIPEIMLRTLLSEMPQDPLQDMADVRAAARKYDFVIVTLHGGHEHDPFPSPRLVQYCRAFADAGASLVFNCHAHCPEGGENWNGTPIIYSPGDFYFPREGQFDRVWRYGYLVRCGFGENGAAGLELLPFYFDNEKVTPLDPEAAECFDRYMEKLCAPLQDPARLQRLFESWSTGSGKSYLNTLTTSVPPGNAWLDLVHERAIRFLAMRVRTALPVNPIATCSSVCSVLPGRNGWSRPPKVLPKSRNCSRASTRRPGNAICQPDFFARRPLHPPVARCQDS